MATHPKKTDAEQMEDAANTEEAGKPMRGLSLVEDALSAEDFPMSRTDIDYSVGDIEIEDGRGGYIPIRQLTENMRREAFKSPDDVLRTLTAARDSLIKKKAA
jgi:hypothetical protein